MVNVSTKIILVLVTVIAAAGCRKEGGGIAEKVHNTLTAGESSKGWKLLFDGKTTTGWRLFNEDSIGQGWLVENGALITIGDGSNIISEEQYENFDLWLDWKISPGGNSGIFYHVVEGEDYNAMHYTAPEYQLIDDVGFPGELKEWQKTGANYAMHNAADNKKLNKVGEWNTSRLVVKDSTVEHWLNGGKILEFERWTAEWKELVKDGKWKDYPDYGLSGNGHIGLQGHGNKLWFRNIKIKEL